jgi:RNA polymerase primary sigma factor
LCLLRQIIDMINDATIIGNSGATTATRRANKPKSARLEGKPESRRIKLFSATPATIRRRTAKTQLPQVVVTSAPPTTIPRTGVVAEVPETPRESDSILAMYMREAGEVPLLKPHEEVELAARIQQGDAAAREHMIRANLRFVIKIAREYEHLGMAMLDLINEGNIGLMKAVEKFDPNKGGKLSTYAALWIKQQIRRALASQGKTIRLPVHVADKIYHISQAEVRLRAQLGREATDEEMAHELGIKVTRLTQLRRAAARPASLDAPLGDDGSSTIAEVVADENAASPFEQLRDGSESKIVRQLVDQLPEREARIIRFRFGLDNGQEKTLEDVGRKLKLTRERIRQVQNIALEKLRKMLEDPKLFPLAA